VAEGIQIRTVTLDGVPGLVRLHVGGEDPWGEETTWAWSIGIPWAARASFTPGSSSLRWPTRWFSRPAFASRLITDVMTRDDDGWSSRRELVERPDKAFHRRRPSQDEPHSGRRVMRTAIGLFLTTVSIWSTPATSQEVAMPPTIADGASLTEVAAGFGFTEGPALSREGHLFFTDIPTGRILQMDPDGMVSVFRQSADVANGLVFDAQGRLHACEGASGRVTRTEDDGSVVVLADQFAGNRFNSPNDLLTARDGSVYFTDPPFFAPRPKPQPVLGVYRISAVGGVSLVISELDQPNGIVQSPDGSTLFVTNDSPAGIGEIWAFDVLVGGSLANRRLFATAARVMDGMTVDEKGNIYATSFNTGSSADGRGVWVFDPSGVLIGFIPTPAQPSNCLLAGDTLYVTASQQVFAVQLNVRGVPLPRTAVEEASWGGLKANPNRPEEGDAN
jgi:gluconolactonase